MDVVLKMAVLKWLGYEGIFFFKMCQEDYGTLTPVWTLEGGIPHSVHFNEGMAVRNFLRTQPDCANWSGEKMDDNYVGILQAALDLCDLLDKVAEYRLDQKHKTTETAQL